MSNVTTRNACSAVNSPEPRPKNVPAGQMYVYDLPPKIRSDLLDVLEEESESRPNLWYEIAERLKIHKERIQDIKRMERNKTLTASPIDHVMRAMDSNAKKLKELFIVLAEFKQVRAMRLIQHLVDEKYLKLFKPENVETPAISDLLRHTNISDNGLPLVINNDSSSVASTTTDPVSSIVEADSIIRAMPEIKYDELTVATNGWDSSYVLGRGGFGTVFRGTWKNTVVAIKRIEPKNDTSKEKYKIELKQSLNEARFLIGCRHDNILPLYGYSISGEKPCLVYMLMEGGTLEQNLYSEKSLTWQFKLLIALGTARGLQFLHTFKEKPLIHGDIKPANILLDLCGRPKIGDFGLARESPSKDPVEISKVYGTRPYLPLEFINSRCLSTKIDTFSFGIVLYELATKKKVYSSTRKPQHLIELMNLYFQHKITVSDVIDTTHLENDRICPHGATVFPLLTLLGQFCTQADPEKRPEMVDVLKRLEGR